MRISFHGHKEHRELKEIWGFAPYPKKPFVTFVVFVAKSTSASLRLCVEIIPRGRWEVLSRVEHVERVEEGR